MTEQIINKNRIVKNTLLLYFRMLFTMAISLYTSRVTLSALGVTDYGIYNVVGGVVLMFTILSASMSAAIGRFITYEIGLNDKERIKNIFNTSVNVQILLIIIITILLESIGLWFLNYKMVIPEDRLISANWVFQFSVLTFAVNLLSVPYNASIIAHEKMSAFAYIGILESLLKLITVYMILLNPFDRLVYYAFLIMLISIVIRFIYGYYCKKHFEECSYKFIIEQKLLKEMFSFAGWNFLGQSSYIINTQGINILINIFFGVTVNAARGIAIQVDNALRQFVNSFMTAVNPQITKSYAIGDIESMKNLIYLSSKFSAYIMLIFAIPIILEVHIIITLWLGKCPEYVDIFSQLTIINTFFDLIFCNSIITAILSTGRIKKYQIIMTACSIIVFPITWIFFELGYPPQASYIIFLIDFIFQIFVRLKLAKNIIGLPPMEYIKKVFFRFYPVAFISFIIPFYIHYIMEESISRLFIVTIVSIMCTTITIYIIGLNRTEKHFIVEKIKRKKI